MEKYFFVTVSALFYKAISQFELHNTDPSQQNMLQNTELVTSSVSVSDSLYSVMMMTACHSNTQ